VNRDDNVDVSRFFWVTNGHIRKSSEPGILAGWQVSTLVPNVTGAGTGTGTVLVVLKTVIEVQENAHRAQLT